MASHKKKGKSSKKSKKSEQREQRRRKKDEEEEPAVQSDEQDVGQRLTLEVLDAISDEEEDGSGGDGGAGGRGSSAIIEGGEEDEEAEWNAEAAALRRAIAEGAFDKLGVTVEGGGDKKEKKKKEEEKEEDVQEVALEDDSSSDDGEGDADESDSDHDEERRQKAISVSSAKALRVVTAELEAAHASMPWAETFDVTSETPLPFGGAAGAEGSPLDVHDDLKREVAFYNAALEAVHVARDRCKAANIPFRRPDDFFAEMVKTDDHMAKVKDRLIFETKKMEAFEQRKSNKEQKLRAKEARSHRAAEKAKAKKDHLRAVDEWAKNAASNRVPGAVRDDDADQLDRLSNRGPNKKRQAADRKYGHGGKRGRFKQNDSKSMNDMSGYNPRGNFPGLGTKSGKAKKGGGGSGASRKGKRARDAARARR